METGLVEESSINDAALVRFSEFHFTPTLGLLGLTVRFLGFTVGLTRLTMRLLGLTVGLTGLTMRLLGLTVSLTGLLGRLALTTPHLVRVSETSNSL